MTTSPIDLDAPVAVTPALGPVPAIYVPRLLPRPGTPSSVRNVIGHLLRHAAKAGA
jgi:hypothetical protein